MSEQPRKVVPARVGFLAIYNPSLGTTDETIEDQIVYYSSTESRGERSRPKGASDAKAIQDAIREVNNEQLRQIGLAQGMVEFGRSFSEGRSVDTIETEKSRIILHELEAGWWILAVCKNFPRELRVLNVAVNKFDNSTRNSQVERERRLREKHNRIFFPRSQTSDTTPRGPLASSLHISPAPCFVIERSFCANQTIKVYSNTWTILGHVSVNMECLDAWKSSEQALWRN